MKIELRLVLRVAIALTLCWLGSATAEAHPATGIVVDRAGNVYFSDLETIWKFSTAGKLTVFRAGQRGRHVHELAIDADDNIYGADVSYNPATKGWPSAVWKMTPDGQITYLIETTENPPRGMSIWLDREGNMYSVDQNNHTKTQTLLLKRTPAGEVTTLAGGPYGHTDGKGAAARFGSIGGMAFGPDGSLYLTDKSTIRRVSPEGEVSTIVNRLDYRDPKDRPRFLSNASESLTGLSVAGDGTIYVADSANRRLLRVTKEGVPEAILHTDPPYFPNGVAAVGHDVYVLEVGFTLPNLSSGPRVRKISANGKQAILATVGATDSGTEEKSSLGVKAGVMAENTLVLFSGDGRWRYTILLLAVGIVSLAFLIWQRKRRARA
jgi:sugar lactone lactonase YvrE